jgi:hypothetical protein
VVARNSTDVPTAHSYYYYYNNNDDDDDDNNNNDNNNNANNNNNNNNNKSSSSSSAVALWSALKTSVFRRSVGLLEREIGSLQSFYLTA